jgi:hypothetical protein
VFAAKASFVLARLPFSMDVGASMQQRATPSVSPPLAQTGEGAPPLVAPSANWLLPLKDCTCPQSRGLRVILLIIATSLMGMADLLLTLTYVQSVGMAEANPIARWLMQFNSVGLVVLFKVGTIAVSGWLILWRRKTRTAEIGAWLCLLVMIALTVRWMWFITAFSSLAQEVGLAALEMDPNYVKIGE